MKFSKSILSEIFIATIFLIILYTGIKIHGDYGIYSDETFHRWAGNLYYLSIKEYLTNLNQQNLLYDQILNYTNQEGFKDWFISPIFFDLFSELIIDLLNIYESENIYKIRHILNFIFYYIAGFFFYILIKKIFNNYFLSVISIFLFFFFPRIFAESFYNTKDILFLSIVVITIYFIYNFLKKRTLKSLIIFSIFCGLSMSVRILGIFLPFFTFFIIIFEDLEDKKKLLKNFRDILISLLIIISVLFMFWPFLWPSPFKNILIYFDFLKSINDKYLFDNLFYSEVITSINVPWYYLLSWIVITVPLSVLFFSFLGFFNLIIFFTKKIVSFEKTNSLWNGLNEKFNFLIFISFFVFIFLSFYTSDFNGWRHFYFLYAFLMYFVIYFINFINKKNLKNLLRVSIIILIIDVIININWMIKNHPFQYVYFNKIKNEIIKKKFDLDYWGLSEKNVLEYILKTDKRDKINLFSISKYSWIQGNFLILKKDEQERLNLSSLQDADYIIDRSSYINNSIDLTLYDKYYEIIIDNFSIIRVYKKI